MNWLWRLWQWLASWFEFRVPPLRGTEVSDLPEKLSPHEIYLVGENGHLWFAAFVCPCGCGETVQLSCLSDARPRWSVTRHADGSVTLYPSVSRVRGCRSHFFIRRGMVIWCSEQSS